MEDVAKKLCTDAQINRAFHYYMVTEHYSGIQITQRGVTYYVTRTSNIRGTAAYELYTYGLWNQTTAGSVDQNPKLAYRLYSEKWHEWVTVPFDVNN